MNSFCAILLVVPSALAHSEDARAHRALEGQQPSTRPTANEGGGRKCNRPPKSERTGKGDKLQKRIFL
jgi:hypothetical protein